MDVAVHQEKEWHFDYCCARIEGVSLGQSREDLMSDFKCHAPVFSGESSFTCCMRALIYGAIIVLLLLATLCLILLSEKGRCLIRQYQYKIKHCHEGNSNPDKII
jgi:hypothetical protein